MSLNLYTTAQTPSPCTWLSHAQSTMSLSDSLTDFSASLSFPTRQQISHPIGIRQGLPSSNAFHSIPCRYLRPRESSFELTNNAQNHAVFQFSNTVALSIDVVFGAYNIHSRCSLASPICWLHLSCYLHRCSIGNGLLAKLCPCRI